MAGELQIELEGPIVAGRPASFRVLFTAREAVIAGGRLRLIYDYRGVDRKESLGQVTAPDAPNFITCTAPNGASPALRTYSVTHSYKPPWSEEPECYMWLDLLGPEVTLNGHVVEATFAERGLPPGEQITFCFGGDRSGFLLSRKSYEAYPVWAILDANGNGNWIAAGRDVLQIRPAALSRVICTLPSVIGLDEEAAPRLQAFDAEHNQVDGVSFEQFIDTCGLERAPERRRMSFSATGERWIERAGEGPVTLESNPVLVQETSPETRIFWGDIHGHCNVCDGGLRSSDEYFAWGRDAMALDFCALSPHDFGIALSGPDDQWNRLQATANAWNTPGSFVTFVGWEASHIGLPSGKPVGHKNVLFRGGRAPFFNGSSYGTHRVQIDYGTYPELIERLEPEDCLVIPHHPLNPVLPGGLGTNWNEFWAERERLVEIHSLWGASETMDASCRTADAVEGTSVLTALMRGYRLGFIAGSDTHDGRPGNPREYWGTVPSAGLAAVFAPSLTREAIYDALWQRSTYATTGARIVLLTDIGRLSMGEIVCLGMQDERIYEREIRVHILGTDEIASIDVIRNGQIVHSFESDGTSVEASWLDCTPLPMIVLRDGDGRRFVFYYVRVSQEDGQRAWSSPVWFDLEASPR